MKIGKKLKNLRVKHNLTMQELANRCDLSKGFISQLEHDLASPSIETLISILEVYDIDLANFFNEQERETKFVFKSHEVSILDEDKYQVKWLIPKAQKLKLEPIIVTLKPFGTSQIINPFQGQMFGYVLSGKVIVHYGNQSNKIDQSETFYIEGNAKHYLENPTNKDTEILWVSNPPIF
ncbi:HTH-type transcriptional regulator PuuR [Spiroplasma sp. JKS002669]|uniref:helix-turn-helix domain-containing protein n=1 Tax=Spiroplasma attinicola TaxID=2904537 RepID=UPI002022ED6D|nr:MULTISPECIES: XRE family transcriptional regulator [unclassified Spiroplasma]MCL6429189.1 HTH-type transcriptional regulator PuuR [Spiroplasma sp. JKS002669]MCL8210309.1 HTH-type transcriptional regulator PuuR [Spiroplasma sp. JKS002671]